jgi:hypothetical protein
MLCILLNVYESVKKKSKVESIAVSQILYIVSFVKMNE